MRVCEGGGEGTGSQLASSMNSHSVWLAKARGHQRHLQRLAKAAVDKLAAAAVHSPLAAAAAAAAAAPHLCVVAHEGRVRRAALPQRHLAVVRHRPAAEAAALLQEPAHLLHLLQEGGGAGCVLVGATWEAGLPPASPAAPGQHRRPPRQQSTGPAPPAAQPPPTLVVSA
jgi:hypothetical protein